MITITVILVFLLVTLVLGTIFLTGLLGIGGLFIMLIPAIIDVAIIIFVVNRLFCRK